MSTPLIRLPIPPLPRLIVEPIVRATLLEDLGRCGDITSDAIVPPTVQAQLHLRSREAGVLAGLDLAQLSFALVDPTIQFKALLEDGAPLLPGDCIAEITGCARAILTTERSALNLMGMLSGVASSTARIANSIAPHGCRVTCTRKTLPGLRALQKYAVRIGGGSNHRFGLDDAILIKDNHIAIAGDLTTAVQRAQAAAGHMVQIEVEVDTLAQLEQALALNVATVLLDNMDLPTLRQAVAMAKGRAITEASGRVNETTAAAVAATGVDLIAVGWITHSAPVLDIGLDVA